MEFTKLGRTGLYVSRLSLGTMNFGSTTSEKDAFYIMDAALDAGINFFDTANNYGFLTGQNGITEEIIGKWFRQGNQRRERVVLATKVHEVMGDPTDGPNDCKGLSIYKIRRHMQASLRRLQTEHVELYYMHHIARNATWDEVWDAFENLYDRGLIDYVGASNFPAWEIARAQETAKARHFMGIAVQQERYCLTSRMPELEVLPACKAYGIGFVSWSPLGGGLLSGKWEETLRKKGLAKEHQVREQQLKAYSRLCHDAGLRESDVALAWVLSNPDITGPIIGVRTMEQLESSLRALTVNLSADLLTALDKNFPGPGGAAPEAYAW